MECSENVYYAANTNERPKMKHANKMKNYSASHTHCSLLLRMFILWLLLLVVVQLNMLTVNGNVLGEET